MPGKYDSVRDSALHFLCCTSEWSNDSFGNVEAPTGYVYRISNKWVDVSTDNTEFNSVIEQWNKYEMNTDNWDFRNSLVGHFLVIEDSNGLVHVRQYDTEYGLLEDYSTLEQEFSEWDSQED